MGNALVSVFQVCLLLASVFSIARCFSCRKLGWRQISQAAVRTFVVVLRPPRCDLAGCPRFASVFWALTWAPLYSAGHVRSATSRALCEVPALSEAEGLEVHTAKSHCLPPNFFHHIFLVRSSQTCTPIAEKISRQYTIENCVSLQRRARFRPQTFHRYLTTYGPGQHPPQVHAKQKNSRLSPIF